MMPNGTENMFATTIIDRVRMEQYPVLKKPFTVIKRAGDENPNRNPYSEDLKKI